MPGTKTHTRLLWIAATLAALVGSNLITYMITSRRLQPPKPMATLASKTQSTNPAPATTPVAPKIAPALPWTEIIVRKNDSLAGIFLRLKLPYAELEKIAHLALAKKYLLNLRPGEHLFFQVNASDTLVALKYRLDADATLMITQKNNQLIAQVIKKPTTQKMLYKSGVVHGSLAKSAFHAGISPALYTEMTKIFAGDINFSEQIRKGDHFAILYNESFINGKAYKTGHIVATTMTLGKKHYTAIRFTYPKNHTSYYTPNGHGIKPLFRLPPVHYKYISGHFTYHRLDPYLHVVRPHLGIDYAALRGTPIHSIGNGRVFFAGKDDGYGNAVIIKYGRKYKALYGHMEKFAKGIHAGVHVKQGQTIGYVGSTGWSTGPHLHFELYVWGTPKNPLKMHFPGGHSVPKAYLTQYLTKAKKIMAKLSLKQGNHSAS